MNQLLIVLCLIAGTWYLVSANLKNDRDDIPLSEVSAPAVLYRRERDLLNDRSICENYRASVLCERGDTANQQTKESTHHICQQAVQNRWIKSA